MMGFQSAQQQPAKVKNRPPPVVKIAPSLFSSASANTHEALSQRNPVCACGGGCPRCIGDFPVQPKLEIGASDDEYEREADQVAEMVMRMPDFGIRSQPT